MLNVRMILLAGVFGVIVSCTNHTPKCVEEIEYKGSRIEESVNRLEALFKEKEAYQKADGLVSYFGRLSIETGVFSRAVSYDKNVSKITGNLLSFAESYRVAIINPLNNLLKEQEKNLIVGEYSDLVKDKELNETHLKEVDNLKLKSQKLVAKWFCKEKK